MRRIPDPTIPANQTKAALGKGIFRGAPNGFLFGKREAAFLYLSMGPIPDTLRAKYRVISPGWNSDFIDVTFIGPEPAGEASAFLRGFTGNKLIRGPYGLYAYKAVPSIIVGFPGTPQRFSLFLFPTIFPKGKEFYEVRKYIFGNIFLAYRFDASLLPHWEYIDRSITAAFQAWAESRN